MRALLSCAVGLLAISVADAHEDVESLHLLQTSLAKVSVHSERECKAAKRAAREKKTKLKEARIAAKTARNAAKVANQVMKDLQTADAEAKAAVESKCPPPEVDMSPDQGCSDTLVTSFVLGADSISNNQAQDLLKRQPKGFGGIQKFVPGGGLPAGQGTAMGSKLGPSIMQPCSVAWTAGAVSTFQTYYNHNTGQYRTPTGETFTVMKKTDFTIQSACDCRKWADTVVKFPEAAAVQWKTPYRNGGPGQCMVWSKVESIPWEQGGFWLALDLSNPADSLTFSCYLGNPEEWKVRLAAEKAAGQTIDKCRKTSLWSYGQFHLQQDPSYQYRTVALQYVGRISTPDPVAGSEGGRKLCLKWVKEDTKCSGAIAIQLSTNGECYCSFSTPGVNAKFRQVPRVPTEDNPDNGLSVMVCML